MFHCDRESKYEKGDRAIVDNIKGTIIDIGILGSKLSPWIFVYSIIDDNRKKYYLIAEDKIKVLCK